MIAKILLILIVFGTLAPYGISQGTNQMNAQDTTSSVPIIKRGHLFVVEAKGLIQNTETKSAPGLVYVNGEVKICPVGDIQLVGEIFSKEGFEWTPTHDAERTLIRSIVLLYDGFSGRNIVDDHYFLARDFPGSVDMAAFARLRGVCSNPKITTENENWRLELYQIRENIGECPVFKYTFSGKISPFTIEAAKTEYLDLVPAVMLKEPIPR